MLFHLAWDCWKIRSQVQLENEIDLMSSLRHPGYERKSEKEASGMFAAGYFQSSMMHDESETPWYSSVLSVSITLGMMCHIVSCSKRTSGAYWQSHQLWSETLRHPNIVSYYGCHWADNHLQMYLEYMAGGSLSQAWLNAEHCWTVVETLSWRKVLSNFGPLEETLMSRYTHKSPVKTRWIGEFARRYALDWLNLYTICFRQQLLSGTASQHWDVPTFQFEAKKRISMNLDDQLLHLGLEYLHTQNPYILHRDIKACGFLMVFYDVHVVHLLFGFAQGANVLVGVDSLVKLADFGCSKRAKETTAVTIEGSIPWMAPEAGVHRNIAKCEVF